MKITYIANARIPTEKAHGLQIFRMCGAFVKNGHEVSLIVPRRLNPIKKNPFDFYNSEKNFKIKYLPIIDTVEFGKLGFILESLQFALVSTIYSLFKKSDLIFSRDEMLAAANILIGKKVVWESHTGSLNFFSKFALSSAEKVVVISEGLKSFYVKKGFSSEKMVVSHDGVSIDEFKIEESKFQCREKLNLPQDKKIILYTGHLYDWKGVYTLADAAKLLDDNFLIVFVGGTERDIKKFSNIYAERKNISILGHKDHNLIPFYLKSADVLIIPNSAKTEIGSKFTSPLKLFEYMASGTPIVASDVPAIREILNENTAVFFKPDDSESLRSSIVAITTDFGLHKRISDNTTESVKDYSWVNRAQIITNSMSSLIAT